ncbi:MAG: hypothetical protein JSS76_07225 [Bacteroidetes bacterium]|nr:hypothetical protein [Bacteroidota bacterium]
MRKIYTLILAICLACGAMAQHVGTYGNEWIDYTPGHIYYKIKVIPKSDSIYRIPYTTLNNSIPNLGAINLNDFALYHNGAQVPIYISANGSGILDSTSYIEFYGRRNYGDADSALYPQSGMQPHTMYSLFNDTSIYYLTTRAGGGNRRFQFVNNDTAAIPSLTEEQYFIHPFYWFYGPNGIIAPGSGGKFTFGTQIGAPDYFYKSTYDLDEAWGGGWVNVSNSPQTLPIATPSVYTAGPPAIVKGNVFTRSYENHHFTIKWNGTTINDFVFDNSSGGFSHHPFSDTLPLTMLSATNSVPFQELSGVSSQQNLLVNIFVYYPRKYDFGGVNRFFWRMAPGSGQRYFRISNVVTTSAQPLLYDITNGYIIRSTDPPATLPKKFVLPAASGERELYFRTDAATYGTISRMDTITFQDYTQLQSTFVIITHPSLRRDSSGADRVEDYRVYRSAKYTTEIYDIDQIINQFGYGVQKTPLATRNFIEYAVDKWGRKPEFVFLIGKGREYDDVRTSAYAYDRDLITPFGAGPSDILLACRRGSDHPLVAIGRLAATQPSDVAHYLEKVQKYESVQAQAGDPYQTKEKKLWMKHNMHFSGGSGFYEQETFASYLGDYANLAADTLWGARTQTIYKTTSQPIDNSSADIIRASIDSGASLMTFFGHAAGTAFDISVDNPANWTNYEKLPIIYSNGCQSGDISDIAYTGATTYIPTFSQSSVLTPGKCAVAFTATAKSSTSLELYEYGLYVYQYLTRNGYTMPWGKALQYAQDSMSVNYGGEDLAMQVAYDMTLHGDPALILNQYPKPDYEIDQNSLYFDPPVVNANVDTFQAKVIVANLGKAIKDSIQIRITRRYPTPSSPMSDTTLIYTWKVKAPYYMDTFSVKIATFPTLTTGYGQNTFTVYVENEHRIDEMSETNNGDNLNFSFAIQSDDIIPVYPYEFAIVPNQNVTLKASTVDPFAAPRNYKIQIDTAETFRHPIAQANIYQGGGVLHWRVPFQFKDSTVYYWRVSRDSINDTLSYRWHGSSFVYIQNEYPGWNQSHYYQYGHDNYQDNMYLAPDREFKFVKNINNLHVLSAWAFEAGGGPIPAAQIRWDYNSVTQYRYNTGGCGFAYGNGNSGGLTFAVIDTLTGQPWQSFQSSIGNVGDKYGNYQCTNNHNYAINGFDFNIQGAVQTPSTGATWPITIARFIDSIPSGCIIVMYSVNQPNWAGMDTGLVNKLASIGATGVRLLKSGAHPPAPYIFFTVKGDPSKSVQKMGINYQSAAEQDYDYGVLWPRGSFASPLIGPALDWGSFHWRYNAKENLTNDHQSVDIIGVSNNGLSTRLYTTNALDTAINFINASQFPYIRLKLNTDDSINHTPTQLYYWRVLYKKVPEAAINPAAHFVQNRDTFNTGDTLKVEMALENVSEISMDSMRTQYTLRGGSGLIPATIVKSDSLRAFDTQILKFTYPMSDSRLPGQDQLTIEANPIDALHQPEQYHFNNYAILNFRSISDKVNPLLDVTFDGRRIMNNDLVSAKPEILIQMKDENKTLALNDTSLAQVYIRYPGQTIPTLINYDNNILTFYPATGNISKNNTAKIAFKPTFMLDGVYDLLVRDKDRSGNFSSNSPSGRYEGTNINGVYYDYKISFNVITKSMISNVLNYPNPFTTRTQFIFTLTGSEVPEYMKIQIMTITGHVVKEIQRAELGDIHIGVNRTDYWWDGRDEFGDKLANGTYFYRVITKIDDKYADNMSSSQYGQFFNNTNIDQYFKHGFGKLVILR